MLIAEPQSDRGVGCWGGNQDLGVLHIDSIHSTNWTSMALTLQCLHELETSVHILEHIYMRWGDMWWNKQLTFPFWASQMMRRLSEPPETKWLSGAKRGITQWWQKIQLELVTVQGNLQATAFITLQANIFFNPPENFKCAYRYTAAVLEWLFKF